MEQMDEDNFGSQILRRIEIHYDEVVKCINVAQVHPYLCKSGLLRRREDKEFMFGHSTTKREKVAHILNCLGPEIGGPGAYVKFVECLEEESAHMGHAYLAVLLNGGMYGEREELEKSAQLEENIRIHRPQMTDIDLTILVGVMFSHKLITPDERDTLTSIFIPRTERISRFFDLILPSKGPLAHGIFAKCLLEEDTQPVHRELYGMITGEEPRPPPNKRRRIMCHSVVARDGVGNPGPITRRYPLLLERKRPLKGKWYDKYMHMFQTFQHDGQWVKLDDLVTHLIQRSEPQLQALAMFEKAVSFLFRNDLEMVKVCANEALGLVEKLPTACDNSRFLMARYKHILAGYYKYTKEYDKARKLTGEARMLLSNCEHGEDLSWVNYGDASTRRAALEASANPPSPGEIEEVQELYSLAIACGRNHTEGTGVVEQYSHIRLAQFALSDLAMTGRHQAQNLETARTSLKAVKETTLILRPKSLYFIIQSNLHRLDGDFSKALKYAKKARKIARQNNYHHELALAETCIDNLRGNGSPACSSKGQHQH